MSRVLSIALMLFCATARPAVAHDGPEHVIEAIDAEIARSGPTAELFYRRACEYRELREYDRAEDDLNAALRLDDKFIIAKFELARILVRRGELIKARTLIEPLIAAEDEHLRASAVALRGELHLLRDEAKPAAADFTKALAVRPEVQWFLLRGEAHYLAGDKQAWLSGLREGWQITSAPALQQALCDALIVLEGLHLPEAAAIIERELADGRYHSTWLLRRARLRFALNDPAGGFADLQAAHTEINSRLNPQRPDPTLVAERLAILRQLGIPLPPTVVVADD